MSETAAVDRVLPCDNCLLAITTPVEGGTTQCARCGAPFAAYARPDTFVPASPPSDEMARRQRLRAQDGRPMLPPPGLESFASGGVLAAQRSQEARMVWSATRRQLASAQSDIAAAERLVWLTLLLRNSFSGTPDEALSRGVFEGALEVLMLPRHRQLIRGSLARIAATAGDFDTADRWLAGCDPCSEDLPADSALRVSRAFVETARNSPQGVLQQLGGSEQEVPIDDAMDALATVLRANAWEKMGRVDGAHAVLTAYMARGGHAQVVESVIRALPAQWQVCVQSFTGAQHEVRQVVAQRAAASGGGALVGWIVLAASGVPVVMLLVFMAQGMFFAPMLTMLIFPVIFGRMGWNMVQSANRSVEIARDGRRGRARIMGVSPTGTIINNVPQMQIDMQVQIDGQPPVAASVRRLMYPGQIPVGAEVPVIWHPKYPNDAVLEV